MPSPLESVSVSHSMISLPNPSRPSLLNTGLVPSKTPREITGQQDHTAKASIHESSLPGSHPHLNSISARAGTACTDVSDANPHLNNPPWLDNYLTVPMPTSPHPFPSANNLLTLLPCMYVQRIEYPQGYPRYAFPLPDRSTTVP